MFGLLPLLPLADIGPVEVLPYNRYVTAAQYARFSSALLGGTTRSAMEANGFQQAGTIGYQAGMTIFGAEAIQLGSPAQAADFERRFLSSACEAGAATDIRPLAGIPGGVTFVYHDAASPPFRATFLVGDTVMRLNVCLCVENRADPHVVLEAWARDVDARIRTLFR